MLGLGAAVTLLVVSSVLAAASLRRPAFTSFLLAIYLLAVAQVVLLTEILSLLDRVGLRGYAVGQLGALAVVAVVWIRTGRPLPAGPDVPNRSLREQPSILLLAVAVGVAVCYQAFLVIATPPNTYDSLAYHLARAAEWHQRGAVDYYPTHTERVNAVQPNAEMLALYGFAFAQRDTFAAVPQLLAEIACLVSVYGIAIRLGFSRAASAYAALLTATLSLVALQSVTTQNDLLTASFVAAALYFVLGRATLELALAGLAVGLALGTKASAFVALPLLLLAALLVLDRRSLLRGVAFACAGFALVGAYGYALNVHHTGRVLGTPDALAPLRRTDAALSGTASTVARLGYNFVDLSGYPVADAATRPLERAGRGLFRLAHIPVNPPGATALGPPVPSPFAFGINRRADETRSYFGPLGALLLLPLSIGYLGLVAFRRAPPILLVPALAIPCFVLGVALSTQYNEFAGRYLLPGVVLAAPLAAWVYPHRRLAAAVASLAVLTLSVAHVDNDVKPSGAKGGPAIWSMTRAEAQSLTWPGMAPVFENVERHVPADGRLGYVLRYNDWIYPFYGPELSRSLVKLPRDGVLEAAERSGLEAVIVAGEIRGQAGGWTAMSFPAVEWTLLLRDRPDS